MRERLLFLQFLKVRASDVLNNLSQMKLFLVIFLYEYVSTWSGLKYAHYGLRNCIKKGLFNLDGRYKLLMLNVDRASIANEDIIIGRVTFRNGSVKVCSM